MMQTGKRHFLGKTIATIGVVFAIWSCNGNGFKGFGTDADTTARDTTEVVVDPDTLALDDDVKAGLIPASMDESFDDFIYSFDQSNRLQRERIVFPLTVTTLEAPTQKITKKNWQHRSVFLGQDFSISFWRDIEQMEHAKNTQHCNANVEQIYLHSREYYTLHFQRDKKVGVWMMDSIEQKSLDKHPLREFLTFYSQWVTDSVYQFEHLAKTIRYSTYDDSGEELVVGTIDATQFQMFSPMLPQDVLTSVSYGQELEEPQQIVLQMRGINSGLECLFTFSRQEDGWVLTAFEN